jgi:hypothetical protein
MCDILAGLVDLTNVAAIIASTYFQTPEEALEHYYEAYWREFPKEQVMELLEKVWPRLIQSRQWGIAMMIPDGYWIETEGVPTKAEPELLPLVDFQPGAKRYVVRMSQPKPRV